MTLSEFEALQVGDIVAVDASNPFVVYNAKGVDKWLVSQEDGTGGVIYHDEIKDWHVVSRVLSRENVNPAKGGE